MFDDEFVLVEQFLLAAVNTLFSYFFLFLLPLFVAGNGSNENINLV
jgi:hypothetical protein